MGSCTFQEVIAIDLTSQTGFGLNAKFLFLEIMQPTPWPFSFPLSNYKDAWLGHLQR